MGFGLLLIGYFVSFAMSLTGNSYYLDIVGGFLMTYALLKLGDHSEKFKQTVPYSMAFVFACFGTASISLFWGNPLALQISSAVRAATILLFHIYVLVALEDMAKGAEDYTLAKRSRRNRKLVIGYFVSYILVEFGKIFFDEVLLAYSAAFIYFYSVLWLIMNLLLLHSAYARLYIEGTEQKFAEMPVYKESRFEFVNKIRRRAYESQKKAYEEDMKLMREAREYAAANRDKYEAKKKKKKHKKK